MKRCSRKCGVNFCRFMKGIWWLVGRVLIFGINVCGVCWSWCIMKKLLFRCSVICYCYIVIIGLYKFKQYKNCVVNDGLFNMCNVLWIDGYKRLYVVQCKFVNDEVCECFVVYGLRFLLCWLFFGCCLVRLILDGS